MFSFIKNKAVTLTLKTLKGKYMDSLIDGLGEIKSIRYQDGKIMLTVVLEGLEGTPIQIAVEEIEIAPDGSSIKIKKFQSSMPFVHNALNRFAVREFKVPDKAKSALLMAKKALGL